MQSIDALVNLIKAVKTHPRLFANLPQNAADDFKEWTAVAQECKMTIAEAQDQWNLLLIEYVEYLKNNQDFSLAHHMDFLQPYFFTINDTESIDEDELIKAIDSKRLEDNDDDYNSEPIRNEYKNFKISLDLEKKIKTEESDSIESSSITFTKNTQSKAISGDNSFTNLSSLELIFLGYAKQLQKMPLSIQLKAKRKIADIMDAAELQMMSCINN